MKTLNLDSRLRDDIKTLWEEGQTVSTGGPDGYDEFLRENGYYRDFPDVEYHEFAKMIENISEEFEA